MAAWEIGRFGRLAEAAAPALLRALERGPFEVRLPAWRALDAIRGSRGESVGRLSAARKGPWDPEYLRGGREEAGRGGEASHPEIEPMPPAERDRIIEALGSRDRFLADVLTEARNYLNPQLNPTFAGHIFQMVGTGQPGGYGWIALLERLGLDFGPGEMTEVNAAAWRWSKIADLLGREGYAHVPKRLPARREPDPDARWAVEEEETVTDILDIQRDRLFREFVADLRAALPPAGFARLAAFLVSLGFPLDG